MKSRSTLLLMEQVIMVMFFSIAAILCIQIFVYAHRTSIRNTQRTEASAVIQSIAEEIKCSGGDLDEIGKVHKGNWNGSTLEIAEEGLEYLVCVTPIENDNPYLGAAEIKAVIGEDTLSAIQVGWQEEAS